LYLKNDSPDVAVGISFKMTSVCVMFKIVFPVG
jgi:hypothetical protein